MGGLHVVELPGGLLRLKGQKKAFIYSSCSSSFSGFISSRQHEQFHAWGELGIYHVGNWKDRPARHFDLACCIWRSKTAQMAGPGDKQCSDTKQAPQSKCTSPVLPCQCWNRTQRTRRFIADVLYLQIVVSYFPLAMQIPAEFKCCAAWRKLC